MARGRVERGLGDKGLLVVSGPHVMRIRAGKNQRAAADSMTPAKRRAQLIGGIEGKTRRSLRGAARTNAGKGLPVVLVVAEETHREIVPVHTGGLRATGGSRST